MKTDDKQIFSSFLIYEAEGKHCWSLTIGYKDKGFVIYNRETEYPEPASVEDCNSQISDFYNKYFWSLRLEVWQKVPESLVKIIPKTNDAKGS